MIEQIQFEEALDRVARSLLIESQPQTVELRAPIDILERRGYRPSQFLAPEGPHATIAKMTDVAGWI